MRDISSSFRNVKRCAFILLFTLSLTRFWAEDFWGVSVPDALGRLRRGDGAFLAQADVSSENLAQAFRLGPGAPFYLSFWFDGLGLEERSRQMLWLQWEKGRGRWRQEAGLRILQALIAGQQYAQAERLGKQWLRQFRTPELRLRCEWAIVEALYWQHKDQELQSRLGPLLGQDEELALFRAVSASRLGNPGWQELFRALFFRHKASSLHVRAFSFLQLEDRLKAFAEAEAAFFAAKAALFAGQAGEALAILEKVLPELPLALLEETPIIGEAATAYFQTGQFGQGARFLLSLSRALPGAAGLEAMEMAGRLYRRAGEPQEAERLLRQVIRETTFSAQRDRAAWFLLDLARERSERSFLEELERQEPAWTDPEYFSDILEKAISSMVAERQWAQLLELKDVLARASAPAGARARLAFLAGRILDLGLARGTEGRSALDLYREAMAASPGSYYAWLASALLPPGERPALKPPPAGDLLEEPDALANPDPQNGARGGWKAAESEEAGREPKALAGALEPFLMGFLELGLHRRGYEQILAERKNLSSAFLLRAAEELQRQEKLLLSLRLMNLYLSGNEGPPGRKELELLYPRGFREEVEGLSEREGIPRPLFFALVREESHFDPEIVSSAGAVGLTQLLPDTAREMAQRLKIADPDLRDPGQNLQLGARYLSRLLLRLEDLPKVLLAYNAGLSRVRGWERSFQELPSELLVEASPFPESRRYVRKILVSAVYYGYLYYDLTPAQTVGVFYPRLAGEREAQ